LGIESVDLPIEESRMGAAPPAFTPGSFLARLEDGERAALLELGSEHAFPSGAILIFEHELEEPVHLLLEGRVKVTHVDRHGRELLLNIRDPGDVLGELALIDREPCSATVSTLGPAVAQVIGSGAFRAHLEATPRVAVVLLETVAGRFREELSTRLQFTESDTMGRLAARILELSRRYGERNADHTTIALPISQQELATWAAASRAGAAQALQAMRELGWITTERGLLTIADEPALRARAG